MGKGKFLLKHVFFVVFFPILMSAGRREGQWVAALGSVPRTVLPAASLRPGLCQWHLVALGGRTWPTGTWQLLAMKMLNSSCPQGALQVVHALHTQLWGSGWRRPLGNPRKAKVTCTGQRHLRCCGFRFGGANQSSPVGWIYSMVTSPQGV